VIVEPYRAVLFDLDGVLYRGTEPIPGAGATIERLRALGKGIAFVTNNSARTPEAVVEHLGAVGIEAAVGEVQTSALATAQLLAGRGVATAFVVGEGGLRTALSDAGVRVVDGELPDAQAVVVGWDRTVDYAKLRTASILIQRGAAFVASNADASFPAADGTLWPGAGALIGSTPTSQAPGVSDGTPSSCSAGSRRWRTWPPPGSNRRTCSTASSISSRRAGPDRRAGVRT
jgi:HAD superfamily hydrolase (TIGR01450 family)